jgi:hypothetical protein
MNTVQQMTSSTGATGCVVHLMLTEGEVGLMPKDPGRLTERLMEEIRLRATQVGPVLEGILHEPHGQPRWGLNE